MTLTAILLLGLRGGPARQLTAREQLGGVDDQRAVLRINARPRVGAGHQAAQDGRHALGRDRQLQGRETVVAEGAARAFDLRQPVGIEHDAARFHRRVGGDGGGDDLALRAQALALRVDQPGVVLAQIEDAAEQDGEPDRIGEDDAPLQRRAKRSGSADPYVRKS